MGCFSYLCKRSGEPALSTSCDGDLVYLFLLKDGKVIEEMFGNYDSYGRVFKEGKEDSFKWKTPWLDIVGLHFGKDNSSGIAMVLARYYDGTYPITRSENDPNQGWGYDSELLEDDCGIVFSEAVKPYHKVYW